MGTNGPSDFGFNPYPWGQPHLLTQYQLPPLIPTQRQQPLVLPPTTNPLLPKKTQILNNLLEKIEARRKEEAARATRQKATTTNATGARARTTSGLTHFGKRRNFLNYSNYETLRNLFNTSKEIEAFIRNVYK